MPYNDDKDDGNNSSRALVEIFCIFAYIVNYSVKVENVEKKNNSIYFLSHIYCIYCI